MQGRNGTAQIADTFALQRRGPRQTGNWTTEASGRTIIPSQLADNLNYTTTAFQENHPYVRAKSKAFHGSLEMEYTSSVLSRIPVNLETTTRKHQMYLKTNPCNPGVSLPIPDEIMFRSNSKPKVSRFQSQNAMHLPNPNPSLENHCCTWLTCPPCAGPPHSLSSSLPTSVQLEGVMMPLFSPTSLKPASEKPASVKPDSENMSDRAS